MTSEQILYQAEMIAFKNKPRFEELESQIKDLTFQIVLLKASNIKLKTEIAPLWGITKYLTSSKDVTYKHKRLAGVVRNVVRFIKDAKGVKHD